MIATEEIEMMYGVGIATNTIEKKKLCQILLESVGNPSLSNSQP